MSEWISVKYKLPKEGDTVLLYKIGIFTGFYVKEKCIYETHEKGWNILCDKEEKLFKEYPVTHWMPLPKPPLID